MYISSILITILKIKIAKKIFNLKIQFTMWYYYTKILCFFFMVNSKHKHKQVERTFQKNRFFGVPKKIKFRLGDSALISLKEARIELLHIGRMKRLIKKLLFRRSRFSKSFYSIRTKVWYFGKTYFYLQKKSKNSRMGKGKGSIDRKVLKLKKNFILFEFYGISLYKLKWFVTKFNKKLNFKFLFLFKKLVLKHHWFKRKSYSFYYKKYLLT